VSPESTKSSAGSGSEGVSCATLATRTGRHVDIAAIRLQLAGDRREQAGLAAAIAPDHADALAIVQGHVDLGQQQAFAAPEREVAEGDHALAPAPSKRLRTKRVPSGLPSVRNRSIPASVFPPLRRMAEHPQRVPGNDRAQTVSHEQHPVAGAPGTSQLGSQQGTNPVGTTVMVFEVAH
jgi:hypothetical protein